MSIHKVFKLLLFLTIPLFCSAQKTSLYTEANLLYKRGMNFYDQNVYGLAQTEFAKAINVLQETNDPEYKLLKTLSELHFAKSAVRMNHPDGERLVLDFARTHAPDPLANQAIVEMANYYFNNKDYDRALQLFENINTYDLPKSQRAEVSFNRGYANFVKKNFSVAKGYFRENTETDSKYTFPSNYYTGLCYFYDEKYDQAAKYFKRVQGSNKYKPHIPYYLATIYFAQGEYDKVIDYAEPKLSNSRLRKLPELNQLVGQSYFETKEYDKAQPYLETYISSASQLRPEDYYQIGFVQYKAGEFKKATKNFEALGNVQNTIGQNAMYLLADCYLKKDDKAAARNAFKNASKLNFDKEIQKEAFFNYAKLSYELNFDREALKALQEIDKSSIYYAEAQDMMSSLFLSTRDYENALRLLNNIPDKTPRMKETYQKVAYLRGVQLIRQGDFRGGKVHLQMSLNVPVNTRTKTMALYWLGDLAHQDKKYNTSIGELNKYFTLAKTLNNLPDEASVHTANYTQGYNYLKQGNFENALTYFQKAVTGIKKNTMFISNNYIKQDLLGDATLRAGDCLFKRKKYNEAIDYYDDAIKNQYNGFHYAMYQKAVIEGLRGKTTNKIIALDDIVDNYPNSEYADDALVQLGATYLEIGQFNPANTALKKLVTKYPNSTLYNQALLRLGLISYNQGNLAGAIDYYKQVFSHNPSATESAAALAALEEIYVDDLGKSEEYFAFIETIPGLTVTDGDKEALSFKAADSQFNSGKYEKAITGYTAYISKYPNGSNVLLALYRRGDSYSILKQYTSALKDYELVIGRGSSAYYAKALKKAALIAYNYEEDFPKAYQLFVKWEQAADNPSDRYEAQEGAMQAAYRMNNMPSVIRWAEKVAANTQATGDQKANANYYIGKIAFEQKDYNKALKAFNSVIKNSNNEKTAEARYLIAYTYYVQRDLDLAQQLCLNANKESSAYPYWVAKSVILLADVLAEKGDLFNAQAVLEGLIENYNDDAELVGIAKAKLELLKGQNAANNRLVPENGNEGELEMEIPDGGK
ncbi:MAG: tetratricopeptide (TPR) repeat protein [Polaribacter sp.]|jgi:tetratricopeptide (TPR) repeat protein